MGRKSKGKVDEHGKECTKCGIYKLYPEFSKRKLGINGYKSICKVCDNKIRTEKRRAKGIEAKIVHKPEDKKRKCNYCGEYKLYPEFAKKKGGVNGYTSRCKLCLNKIQNEKNKQNKIETEPEYKIDEGGRECVICHEYQLWDGFYKSKTGINGHESRCKVCLKEQRRAKGIKVKPEYRIDEHGRECTCCGKYRLKEVFSKKKDSANGHASRCKICVAEQKKKYNKEHKEEMSKSNKKYREEHKEELAEYNKEWYKDNKEHIAEYGKTRYEENKEYILERQKKYEKKNREKTNERNRGRYKNDPEFKLSSNLRSRVGMALSAQNAKKFHHTMDLIGCSPAFLMSHLNDNPNGLKFKDVSMHGNHNDHILACANFNLHDTLERFICFNWRNLQLLKSGDNGTKGTILPNNAKELYNEIKDNVLKDHPELKHLSKSWDVWCNNIGQKKDKLK